MKAKEFYKNVENGLYGIPNEPKPININDREMEIRNEIPKVINENRSVKWNREERERCINKKLEEEIRKHSVLLTKWHEQEKDIIIRFYEDREEMYMEELDLNKKQLYLFFNKILNINLIRHTTLDETQLKQCKELLNNIRELVKL